MLPEVVLQNVSREDVDRIAWWLEDSEVSSKWFGHYGCGDPVHRGYDPLHMMEASQSEWERVFSDPHRAIFSVYDHSREHIGECQFILDGDGGAELSLLIGRKDLWHRGYGTATVMVMLDRAFDSLGVDRAWVAVPEDNSPALGLFEKLGFVRNAARDLCTTPEGAALRASILAIDLTTYRARRPGAERPEWPPTIVTINGLTGSGAESIAKETARLTGMRFVDEELSERLCRRLRCSPAELADFERSFRSGWTRLLNAIVVPMEWSVTYDTGYQWFTSEPPTDEGHGLEDQITKKQYVEAMASAVRRFAAEGNVVLHGNGSQLFAPKGPRTISVFVAASKGVRRERIAAEQGWDLEEAARWLSKNDRETLSIFSNLLGSDMLDEGLYDLTVNLDRTSPESAAEMVAGAVGVPLATTRSNTGYKVPAAPVG